MLENSFGRSEKIKGKTKLDALFKAGHSFHVFPLRITYSFLPEKEKSQVRVGVTASKKIYKKAVDRNRIKRLLRESYRLQKEELAAAATQKKMDCLVFFMYTHKEILSFEEVKAAMAKALVTLQQKLIKWNESAA